MESTDSIKRIFDVPAYQLRNYNLDIAIAHRTTDKWESLSSRQYVDRVDSMARALIAKGIQKGDKIGIISGNRMEWVIVDQAIMKVGAITVPIYPTISQDDYIYIFNHSEIRLCFVSDKFLNKKVVSIQDKAPALEGVYTFENVEGAEHWSEIEKLGHDTSLQSKVDEIAATIQTDDIATLIYTSGTTGTPKGVLLSHNNIISNITAALPRVPEIVRGRALSFLPLCHIYERTVSMAYQVVGCGVHFAKSTETIAVDALHVKPTVMMVVPRVVEKLYAKIHAKGVALSGLKKFIFFWAVRVGKRYEPYSNNIFYKIELAIARALVFKKWREALGGEIVLMISGSSCLNKSLSRLFCAAGIVLNEGYGLTETSPIVATNVWFNKGLRIGSVGRPLNNFEFKIAKDGEILVKGPCVMKGYYKDPERSAEVFDEEGFLHTGDIGNITDGFLYITDRKKEMFKTSGGKYITPQPMENHLKQSRFIEQAMIVGDNKKHPAAIIEPDFSFLKEWCGIKGYKFDSLDQMLKSSEVLDRYKKEITEVNKNLGSWEKVKSFRLVPDAWTVESGYVTPTLKLKRRNLTLKYQDLIDDIYKDEELDVI